MIVPSIISGIAAAAQYLAPYAVRVGLLGFFFIAVKLLPWPDIEPYLTFIPDGINKLYFMNPIMDMDVAFTLTRWVLGIELAYLIFRLVVVTVRFVASGTLSQLSDDTNPNDYQ